MVVERDGIDREVEGVLVNVVLLQGTGGLLSLVSCFLCLWVSLYHGVLFGNLLCELILQMIYFVVVLFNKFHYWPLVFDLCKRH